VRYEVCLDDAAVRDLERLSGSLRAVLFARIQALAEEPRPAGAKALIGELSGSYRLKVRQAYRIGFEIDDEAKIVTVWGVGHRSRFYERARRRQR
jgi:mRNA interferase RelE/StbE